MLIVLIISNLLFLWVAVSYWRKLNDASTLIRCGVTGDTATKMLREAAEKAVAAETEYNNRRALYKIYWSGDTSLTYTVEPTKRWLAVSKRQRDTTAADFQSLRRTLTRNHPTAPTGLGEKPLIYLTLKHA